jgi:hypothetical protein
VLAAIKLTNTKQHAGRREAATLARGLMRLHEVDARWVLYFVLWLYTQMQDTGNGADATAV